MPTFIVGVADAPVPPFTTVNTNEGADVYPEPPFNIVIPVTDAGTIEQVITAPAPAVDKTVIVGADK